MNLLEVQSQSFWWYKDELYRVLADSLVRANPTQEQLILGKDTHIGWTRYFGCLLRERMGGYEKPLQGVALRKTSRRIGDS